ncbi:MAG: PAS domain-containing protein, partial [Sphingobacteriales bacterium]
MKGFESERWSFLRNGGDMGQFILDQHWSQAGPGDPVGWPAPLRISLGNMLAAGLPTLLFWSPELYCFCNDAAFRVLGERCSPVGSRFAEVAVSFPSTFGEALREVMETGKPCEVKESKRPSNGSKSPESTYCLSSIQDENGAPAGVWVSMLVKEHSSEEQSFNGSTSELMEALRASEDRYQNFIHQSTEGIWRFEVRKPIPTGLPEDEQISAFFREGYLAECNNAMARMYGFENAEEL